MGKLDFLISTDVFEHVAPPVSLAFENARRLLKPDGVLICSVPYELEGETREHFPDLYEYRVERRDGKSLLLNKTRQGELQEFSDLIFHGGGGATLEMRVFSESSLHRDLLTAGFVDVEFYRGQFFENGIYWPYFSGVPVAAHSTSGTSGKRERLFFQVTSWGPAETLIGQGFNVQPDGCSAFWFRGLGLQHIVRLQIGPYTLTPTLSWDREILTATLPRDTDLPVGQFPIVAENDAGMTSEIGLFRVIELPD